MNNLIILQGITKEELLKDIEAIIENKLNLSKENVTYLTTSEAAKKLRITVRTIHNLFASGILTPIKAGTSKIFIKSDEVESLFKNKYNY